MDKRNSPPFVVFQSFVNYIDNFATNLTVFLCQNV